MKSEDVKALVSHRMEKSKESIKAVLTTLLGSLYPAWKASNMKVVDALRYNR